MREKSSSSTHPASLSQGQRAYEQRRADKAGMPLEKWLQLKEKKAQEEREAAQAQAPRKKGFFSRLLDRAHKPL